MEIILRKAVHFFGCPMHPWTRLQTVQEIERRIDARQFTQHVVVNVAKIVNMRSDLSLRKSVIESDIVSIDGVGVVWGGRFLGLKIPERVAGIDLFNELLGLSEKKGYPVFLLGAKPEVLEEAVDSINRKYPNIRIVGSHHGYFWDDEPSVVKKISDSDARLLFVAISSPKKETFINNWRDRLNVDFVMGVGGSIDIFGGLVNRAPEWMQRAGLEWLYRVFQEPRRMWKRYLVTNLEFAGMLIREKLGLRTMDD